MAEFKPKYVDLVTMLQDAFKNFADRRLFGSKLTGEWKWFTYAEVGRMVERFRAELAALGVKQGDRVAVISNNRVEWAVGAWATFSLGGTYVPMYEAQLERDWKYILKDSGAKVCLAATDAIFDKIAAMKGDVPTLERVIGFQRVAEDATSYNHLMSKGAAPLVPPVTPRPDDIACYLYTSGTTGNPKGVELMHSNLACNVSAIDEIIPFTMEDTSVAFLPWAHSFGQTVDLHALSSIGACIAICESTDKLVQYLGEVKPTVLVAVPRIFNRIYDNVNKNVRSKPGLIQAIFRSGLRSAGKIRDGQPRSLGEKIALPLARKLIFSKVLHLVGGRLKYVVSGSAALSKDVAEFIDNLGIMVFEGYGLTETSPVTNANRPGYRKMGSVGQTLPGITVKLDHEASGDPDQGEIIVHGHCVMKGYHNLPDETKAVFTADGGFRTGDLGRIDKDGFLFITGRIKEQYKLETGKYVAPAHLEEQITLSPYIAQCMVHGVNKPYNIAIVVPDMASLKEWAAKNGIDAGNADVLLRHEKVMELIRGEIEKHSGDFKSYDKIKKFFLIGEEFSAGNDMLTQTLKIKRRVVVKKYEQQIEALYADEPKRAAV